MKIQLHTPKGIVEHQLDAKEIDQLKEYSLKDPVTSAIIKTLANQLGIDYNELTAKVKNNLDFESAPPPVAFTIRTK